MKHILDKIEKTFTNWGPVTGKDSLHFLGKYKRKKLIFQVIHYELFHRKQNNQKHRLSQEKLKWPERPI